MSRRLTAEPARSAPALAATFAIAAALSVLAGCAKPEPPPPQPRLVRTIVVEGTTPGGVANYTAEVRSRYESELSFQVSGKIVSRAVDAGALVKKGAVLAELDATDYRTGVDGAKAAVAAARAELDRARTEEARFRDLLERGLTTRASYLAQQTAVKTGQSQFEQASAELQLNEQKLGYTTLRADSDGVVTRLYSEVGGVVAAGQRVLSLARPDELEAVFDVPDGRVDGVRGATAVRVLPLGDESATGDSTGYAATIREIAPTADPATRTYLVKASIAGGAANLRLGTSVTVEMSMSEAAATIALPASALFQKGSEPALWIVREDSTLELRPVTVARYESDRVLIAAGVAEGERVVTAGVHRLAENEQVRLMSEPGHE